MSDADSVPPPRTEVPAQRVDGIIPLAAIVQRVRDRAAAESASESSAPERAQRLDRIARLAADLEHELAALDRTDEQGSR